MSSRRRALGSASSPRHQLAASTISSVVGESCKKSDVCFPPRSSRTALKLEDAEPVELLVCGGAALVKLGYISRATEDIDVLALVVGGRGASADPFSSELIAAARRVARDMGMPSDWINPGPASAQILGARSRTATLPLARGRSTATAPRAPRAWVEASSARTWAATSLAARRAHETANA